MSRICPRCMTSWSDEIEFCPHDGSPLSAPLPSGDVTLFAGGSRPPRGKTTTLGPGAKLGSYVIKELLGEGGMGKVFKAEHELLGRSVAIKVLLEEYAKRPDIVHRFFKEAESVNRIRHPNIIDITDFVVGSECPPYLVMELLSGQSLAEHIYHHAPIKPAQTVSIMKQVCDAMSAVHKLGIVHRDMKPDNIYLILQPSGEYLPKLLDFGIAKFLVTDETFLKTRTGELVGTPEYMAPEQVQGLNVDQRIDIYATGVILFEMLTGKQPFTGTLSEILSHHLSDDPPRPSDWLSTEEWTISPALDETVLKCMAKDPDERVQSMGQLKELLELAVEDDEAEVVVLTELPRSPARRYLWTAVAALVLLLAAGVIWAVAGRRSSSGGRNGGDAGPGSAASGMKAGTRPSPGLPSTKAGERVVEIVSQPSQAAVFHAADGRFVGHTPAKLRLQGDRRVEYILRKEGHVESKVAVGFDSPSPVMVILSEKASASRSEEGSDPRESSRKGHRKHRKGRDGHRAADDGTVNPFRR